MAEVIFIVYLCRLAEGGGEKTDISVRVWKYFKKMDGLLDDLPQATTFEDVSQVLLSSALSLVGEVVFGESTLNLSSERAPHFLP